MARLYVLQGPDKGRTIEVPEKPIILGRDSDYFPLTDQTISRNHARLTPHRGKWALEDMNSANGTFANGMRISSVVELRPGDQIRIGGTILVFMADQTAALSMSDSDAGQMVNVDEGGKMVDSSIMAALPANEDSVIIAAPETADAVGNLRLLYKLAIEVTSVFTIDQLLARVMDMVFEQIRVDRGFVLLLEENTNTLKSKVVRYRHRQAASKISTSRTIIRHVLEKKEGVLCTNAMADQRFRDGQSVQDYALRSVICVPIIAREKVLGIIHIDSSMSNYTYTQEHLRLMTAVGYQTGLAIMNTRLYEENVRSERLAATGETVAALSHYIKNILQGLRGGEDMIEMGLEGEQLSLINKGWQIARRNLDKIHTLALNMLAYSKQREPRLEPVQINQIVQDVVDLTQRQADDRGIMLVTDTDDDCPPVMVDPDGIHQVILNIVVNALDAVEKSRGVITIKTSYNEHDSSLTFSIGDNGPGIDPKQVQQIFEAFHSTKGHGGTGLGLAVAKKIIDEHNGTINVNSQPDQGTVFTVTLPAEEQQENGGHRTHGPAA